MNLVNNINTLQRRLFTQPYHNKKKDNKYRYDYSPQRMDWNLYVPNTPEFSGFNFDKQREKIVMRKRSIEKMIIKKKWTFPTRQALFKSKIKEAQHGRRSSMIMVDFNETLKNQKTAHYQKLSQPTSRMTIMTTTTATH